MDIRIVNTCNSNCMYCLEQNLRKKEKFINKQEIFSMIRNNSEKGVLSIYGWNPLLHPDLDEIIQDAKLQGYGSINILTNTRGLSELQLKNLQKVGLTGINFYFHSFSVDVHNRIVNGGIILDELLRNIWYIHAMGFHCKAIIHVNRQNIELLHRDIFILYSKFWIQNIEFVNYFPFDRPYEKYHNILSYDTSDYRDSIDLIFKMVKKLWIQVNFTKFQKDFFGDFTEYYNFKKWVLDQIWEEDYERLDTDMSICYTPSRCSHCFIKDNCKMHA